jgi:hypothetical protein
MTLREIGFWNWLVSKLPAKLVYFCFMRVWSGAVDSGDTCAQAITAFSVENEIEL